MYEKLFNARLVDHMPFDKAIGAGMGLPADFDYENSTMHAELDFSGSKVYISDAMDETALGPVEILLDFDSREEIEAVWAKVKKMNLRIVMELEPRFWGALYGSFMDNDGVGWQLNHSMNQE